MTVKYSRLLLQILPSLILSSLVAQAKKTLERSTSISLTKFNVNHKSQQAISTPQTKADSTFNHHGQSSIFYFATTAVDGGAAAAARLRDFATVPSRNPFLNRRWTSFIWRMRPVPVVFRRMAFTLQLYLRIRFAGYPHAEQRCFWMWYDERPHRRHSVCVLLWRLPKLDVPFVIFRNYLSSLKTFQSIKRVRIRCFRIFENSER